MVWKISLSAVAKKQMLKIDKNTSKEIVKYLESRISLAANPRQYGKALSYNKKGPLALSCWRPQDNLSNYR